jgi:hypothetical protein
MPTKEPAFALGWEQNMREAILAGLHCQEK